MKVSLELELKEILIFFIVILSIGWIITDLYKAFKKIELKSLCVLQRNKDKGKAKQLPNHI